MPLPTNLTCNAINASALQERADCSRELSAAELASITTAPRAVDFGKVSTARAATAYFTVTNPLAACIHVALDLVRVPELAGSGPLAQVRGAQRCVASVRRCTVIQQRMYTFHAPIPCCAT